MVVISFFFASICSWMLYLPVQWNKFTPTSGYLARHGQPMRRHQGPPGRARNTVGFAQGKAPPSAEEAAKALASPVVASPYPFSEYTTNAAADDGEAFQRRMMMSKHSEQHRTLIDLLRERGTLGVDERVPEDDIFEDEEAAEARWGMVAPASGAGAGAGRKAGEEGTFATALVEPSGYGAHHHVPPPPPTGVEPVYGAREHGERVPVNNVPHVVSASSPVYWR